MLTVLSFGAGQDSTAILYKLSLDKNFYKSYVKGKLIVIMSDTGDEHDATYGHVKFIENFCKKAGFEFYFIKSEMGYHPKSWPGLIEWMKKHSGLMSRAFPKTCTVNLKIVPIYNFLDHYIGRTIYKADIPHTKSKKGFIKLYCRQYGKIRILLGIAKGEESRCSSKMPQSWMRKCLDRIYPLIDIGWRRYECQEWIKTTGLPLPPPSNCKRCPFLNEIELLWLYRFHPTDYKEWVELERAKIDKWKDKGKRNLGVFGNKLLPAVLKKSIAKYGHWTDEQLHDYKMSHGHCVKSKY